MIHDHPYDNDHNSRCGTDFLNIQSQSVLLFPVYSYIHIQTDNSLNLAVSQSRKTIIWKREQVGAPNWGVFWQNSILLAKNGKDRCNQEILAGSIFG